MSTEEGGRSGDTFIESIQRDYASTGLAHSHVLAEVNRLHGIASDEVLHELRKHVRRVQFHASKLLAFRRYLVAPDA